LLKIKPNKIDPESLVFTSKTGKQVNGLTFYRTWKGKKHNNQKSIIQSLIEQGKVKQYLKPYATRHTFISAQVDMGIDAHVIAAWVGNSAQVIWDHYYQHKRDAKPGEM
jgi:integrase